jgi:hypothetical protein
VGKIGVVEPRLFDHFRLSEFRCLLRPLTVRQLEPVGNAIVTEPFTRFRPEKTRDSLRDRDKVSLRPKHTSPSRIGNPLGLPLRKITVYISYI